MKGLTAILVVLIMTSLQGIGQDIDQLRQLVGTGSPFTSEGDELGKSIAIEGEWAVVGSPERSLDTAVNTSVLGGGGISIYRKITGTWTKIKDIQSTNQSNQIFGHAVAISGDHIVVGDPSGSGGAFIYGKDVGGTNNWGHVKTVQSSDWVNNDTTES